MRVAADLFDRKGYVETTMHDIARELNVSKPTLYTYARGKRQILQNIIEHWMETADQALKAAEKQPNQATRFEVLVIGWTQTAVENAAVAKVFLSEEQDLPPQFVQRYRLWSKRAYRRIRRMFTDNQASGIFSPELNPTVAVFTFIAFVNHLPSWYDKQGPLSSLEVAQSFLSIVGHFAPRRAPSRPD